MNLEEKVEFFKYLVKIGFKEIEVGFPAASETEYQFVRYLIENDCIPEEFGYFIKGISDKIGRELTAEEIYEYMQSYLKRRNMKNGEIK